jgi:hypothetical protein
MTCRSLPASSIPNPGPKYSGFLPDCRAAGYRQIRAISRYSSTAPPTIANRSFPAMAPRVFGVLRLRHIREGFTSRCWLCAIAPQGRCIGSGLHLCCAAWCDKQWVCPSTVRVVPARATELAIKGHHVLADGLAANVQAIRRKVCVGVANRQPAQNQQFPRDSLLHPNDFRIPSDRDFDARP